MNFFDYIDVSPALFEKAYLDTGLVQKNEHDTFPLDIYTYGRKAVSDQVWDGVTSKCRGIVVHRVTGDIIARPFEKFHNYGSSFAGPLPVGPAVVQEKLDGFMVTGYQWDGKWYAASKGSFHSPHAKWATAELQKHNPRFPEGYTPVFEGLCRDLRIVVDYGDREGLVLLALVHNDTGGEIVNDVPLWAGTNGFEYVKRADFSLEGAVAETLREYKDGLGTEEGFVVLWPSLYNVPIRVKLKYVDYLRLHRLVTGVSPKAIWEALSQPHLKSVLDEFLNNSTPWFKTFTEKWVRALRQRYDEYATRATEVFQQARIDVTEQAIRFSQEHGLVMPMHMMRKFYAERFMTPENKEISGILFAMLDGKRVDAVIWKQVKNMTKDAGPLRDGLFN